MPGMLFTLTGDDDLTGTLDGAGDAAQRLARRLDAAARSGNASMYGFTRDSQGRLRDLQGRYITTAEAQRLLTAGTGDLATRMRTTAPAVRDTSSAIDELGKVTRLLWPAAIPAAASLAPLAVGALTVGAGMAAMGAAIIPQISALGDVTEAEKAWTDAVDKNGARSQQAVQAQAEYAATVAKLPPETRRAAAAVGVLKDNYRQFSDGLADDTMPAFTKSVGIVNALLPKTAGLAKMTAVEADRFMTVIGGEVASPGLDRLNSKFTVFAQKTLRNVNDEIVHLLRTGGSGEFGGNAREFLEWARAQGPTVASVLRSVAEAVIHVLDAGSGVGVGLLQTVEIVARLVSAVPPDAIATFLQLALALKLVKVAALGFGAARTAVLGFVAQLVAMQTAAAAAPGRLAAVRAAVLALSRTTKIAMAGTGLGLAILAITELAERSQHAPPDVDKLTGSLRVLGTTGKVTGEAAKAFGSDLDGLYDKVRSLTDPTTTDKVQQFLVGWTGWDSTPVKDAKADLGAVDDALANLVQGGQADLAAAAVKRLTAEYGKGGRDTKEFTNQLDGYKSAVADAKFEQDLAAQSMGLFGSQAQSVQEKLNAQKQSADGLRQSIQALNDVQRAGLGGMIGFEASIDAAAKAARDNAGALSMSHGQLNLNSEKARNAATALQDLASKTDEAASSARESGSSWETVNGIYTRGRSAFIANARAMGLNKIEAAALADQILKIPDKTAQVDMRTEDAQHDLEAFNAAVKKSPGSKSVTLKTLSAAAQQVLESFGYKVTHLKDGRVTVTALTGGALTGVRNVASAIAALRSKSVTITTNKVTKFSTVGAPASGGIPVAKRDYATGGLVGFPGGGPVSGPGTGTSDSIPAMLSNGEFVINAKSTARYRSLLEAINAGRLGDGYGMAGAGAAVAAGLMSGMAASTGGVGAAARQMAAAVTTGVKDELQIASPSKVTKALAADTGKGLIVGMTGTRSKIQSTAADLAKDIRAALSGKKETALVSMVDRQTKKLLDLAAKRDKAVSAIAAARSFAGELTKNAADGAGLGSLGMQPEDVTAGGIKGGLAGKLAQIKQFTAYIAMLSKRGLSKDLLRQILNMGPDAGYAYASALVGADKATFGSINSLQAQIGKSATSLGVWGADALYDSGRNAAKGFLTGLSSQQAELQKTMERLAKSMQTALRKALGIRSPARKMVPDGINAARGVAVGVLAGLPHVDRAMDALSGRITGRAALSPTAGRPAVAGGGGVVYQVQVDVHDAMDPVAVGREVQRVLLQLGRAQGKSVQLSIGG